MALLRGLGFGAQAIIRSTSPVGARMEDIQYEIQRMKKMVDVARQEIELAVMFHETWRPAAYDADLHARIGASYAGHAFLIIRLALRRELLLALTRLWDSNKKAVRMGLIADWLRNKRLFDALVQQRTQRLRLETSFAYGAIKAELVSKRDQVLALIGKYSAGGSAAVVLEKVTKVRHKHLAHRQVPTIPAELDQISQQSHAGSDSVDLATDDEIEAFYQDNLQLVSLLLSLVQAHSYDMSQAAAVYKHHAKFFWASARGERTEGHPAYRVPPS